MSVEEETEEDKNSGPKRRFMYMTKEEDEILKMKGDMEASLMKKAKPLKVVKARNVGGFKGVDSVGALLIRRRGIESKRRPKARKNGLTTKLSHPRLIYSPNLTRMLPSCKRL